RSIAGLSDSLSTLRRLGYPSRRKTRIQPLVRRYWTGFPPAGLQRKVSEYRHLILLSQALLGAITSTDASAGTCGAAILAASSLRSVGINRGGKGGLSPVPLRCPSCGGGRGRDRGPRQLGEGDDAAQALGVECTAFAHPPAERLPARPGRPPK